MTHEHFYKCNNTQLIAFILSRKSDVPKSRLQKKGKVADAIQGENNLLSIAFFHSIKALSLLNNQD